MLFVKFYICDTIPAFLSCKEKQVISQKTHALVKYDTVKHCVKISKCGVFSGPYFTLFEVHTVSFF